MSINIGNGGGASTSAGFKLGVSQNIFDADGGDKSSAILLRDTYATNNPTWLSQYQSDFDDKSPSSVLLLYTEGGKSVATYTQYSGSVQGWRDLSTAKGLRGEGGPQGGVGDHVDSAEFVGDDIVFGDTGGREFPLVDAVNVLKGDKGDAAPMLLTQFSIGPNGPWVDSAEFTLNPELYYYWRWSTDNSATWSPSGVSVRATVTNLPNGFGWFDDGQGGLTLKKGDDVYLTMTPDEVQSKRLNVINNVLKFGPSKSVHDVSENILFKNNITGQVFHPVWQKATDNTWDATVRRPLGIFTRQNNLTEGFQASKVSTSTPAAMTITAQFNLRVRAFYIDSLATHTDCTMLITQGGKTKVIIEHINVVEGENQIILEDTSDGLPFLDLLKGQTFLITFTDSTGNLIDVREMEGSEGHMWWALDFTEFEDVLVLDARRTGGSIAFNEENGVFDVLKATNSQLGVVKAGVGLAMQPDGTIYSTVSGSIVTAVADEAGRLALPQIAQAYTCIQSDVEQVYYLGANEDPSVLVSWIEGGSTAATITGFKGVGDTTARTGVIEATRGDYTSEEITFTDAGTGVVRKLIFENGELFGEEI